MSASAIFSKRERSSSQNLKSLSRSEDSSRVISGILTWRLGSEDPTAESVFQKCWAIVSKQSALLIIEGSLFFNNSRSDFPLEVIFTMFLYL